MFGQKIKDFFDKHRPKFEKGGKLHPFHSVFEGFETFLYVSDATTKKGAHVRDYVDLKRTMIFVVLALVPTMLFGMYNIGYQHFKAIGELANTSLSMFSFTVCSGFCRLSWFRTWLVWVSSSLLPKSKGTRSTKDTSFRVCSSLWCSLSTPRFG
jgi:Na+-transporting NADH:ubiquinone oxidoreductase subunit NqrB